MKKLLLIPLDVWIALTISVGILAAQDDFMLIFVGAYAMLCAYVVTMSFTES